MHNVVSCIKGPMSYDQNGDYQVVVEIDQIRNGESVLVGYYSPFTDDIEWLVEQESLFPGKISFLFHFYFMLLL